MKKQLKWLSVLLAIVLCFLTFAGCSEEAVSSDRSKPSSEPVSDTPLLYKVTASNGAVVWLFGSIHGGSEKPVFPSYVTDAFEQSDRLAVECDVVAFEKDLSAQINALKYFLYPDGSKISDHIEDTLYQQAKQILQENNQYTALYDYYLPSLWSNMLTQILYSKVDIQAENGIDRYLIDQAYQTDKEIVEVESVDFQYAMLAGFSEPIQLLMLQSSIQALQSIDEQKQILDRLLRAWQEGNSEEMEKLLFSEVDEMTGQQKDLYDQYCDVVYTQRNHSMTDFAEQALQNGEKTFICVGVAHVIGEEGMAALLKKRGYQVTLVLASS